MTTGRPAIHCKSGVRTAKRLAGRALYRWVLSAHWLLLRLLRRRPAPLAASGRRRLLLTGTFYSANWVLNHVRPLAASEQCQAVWLVTTFDVPATGKVEVIRPPLWLIRTTGEVPARLLTCLVIAIRRRPDFVGGFHLLPNGLFAVLLARLIGSRSVYFCGGGPREVQGGGYYSGARSFRLLLAPDETLEAMLIRAVGEIDLVVTMGKGARDFLRTRGVRTQIEVVPGGVDDARLPSAPGRRYDLILVGRLHPVKRIDLFLRTVAALTRCVPDVSAVIVGGGELEGALRELAVELGIEGRVTFTGQQTDVGCWLGQARVFVLTSESEGLSLALMEAMTVGLPCVVANVGDLGELVEHGKTGFLVNGDSPEAFCGHLERLLKDQSMHAKFAVASRRAATQLTTTETGRTWDRVLTCF